MKKMKYLLLLSVVLLFTSCSGALDIISEAVTPKEPGVDVVIPEPEAGVNYYTLPDNPGKVTLPTAFEDKDIFLIYTNTSSKDEYASSDTVSIPSENTSRSATSDFNKTVIEKAVVYENGFYRNDVNYEISEELKALKKQKIIPFSRNVSNDTQNSSYYNPALSETLEEGAQVNFFYNSGEDADGNDIVSKDKFTLKKIGNKCRIWVLNNNPQVIDTEDSTKGFTATDYDNIASAIDNQYVNVTKIFGSNVFDGESWGITATTDTKLEVLVYDLYCDATPSTTGGTYGFFWGKDFYQNKVSSNKISNECQLINIDSYFLKKSQNQTISTLIHEFQHLLNFCNKDDYSTWFTEMLSLCAEDIFLNQLEVEEDDGPMGRISNGFYGKPYQGFGDWGVGEDNQATYYSYCNAYAYGAFLMRNFGDIQIIEKIAKSNKGDKEAINEALKDNYPQENFDTVLTKLGMSFIYTDNSSYSLNKQVGRRYGQTNFIVNPINMDDALFYCCNISGSNTETRDQSFVNWLLNNLYIKPNITGYARETDCSPAKYYFKAPKIFKSNYKLTEPVRPYGFVVYYLGHSGENQTYTFDKYSNLTATIVAK